MHPTNDRRDSHRQRRSHRIRPTIVCLVTMTNTTARIYSLGYTGFRYEALIAFVRERPRLLLADVRLKPFSRFHPRWSRSHLQAALGTQYEWFEQLGNLNYKGGPITLKDPAIGIEMLRRRLDAHDLAIMCACRDPQHCHRSTITGLLEAEGWTVEQVSASPPGQPPLVLD
jgi:uncharacterized protein (DUF488 family)